MSVGDNRKAQETDDDEIIYKPIPFLHTCLFGSKKLISKDKYFISLNKSMIYNRTHFKKSQANV